MTRILGYIPARLGSVRVKAKNLRLLNGRPMISYAIDTVLRARSVERFVVNTESEEIASVARQFGIGTYMRPPELAVSTTSTDEIVIDFINKNPCDAVVLVNPTAPFLKPETIDRAVATFLEKRPTSLFTSSVVRRHAFMEGRSINFDTAQRSPRTQDLTPITMINFIICIFDAAYAKQQYERVGCFLYNGSNAFMEMDDEESFDIDYEHEFRVAEALLAGGSPAAQYDTIIDARLRGGERTER